MDSLEQFAHDLLAHSPAEYLRDRLQLLMLVRGRPDELSRLATQPLAVGAVTITTEAVEAEEPGAAASTSADRFILMESSALLHQAAETLWLWYLAANTAPLAPWFSLPAITPAVLKEGVRDFSGLSQDGREPLLGRAFLALPAAPGAGAQDAALGEALRELGSQLVWFGRPVLENAVYNGLKHGGVGVASRQDLRLAVDDVEIEWARGETPCCDSDRLQTCTAPTVGARAPLVLPRRLPCRRPHGMPSTGPHLASSPSPPRDGTSALPRSGRARRLRRGKNAP